MDAVGCSCEEARSTICTIVVLWYCRLLTRTATRSRDLGVPLLFDVWATLLRGTFQSGTGTAEAGFYGGSRARPNSKLHSK